MRNGVLQREKKCTIMESLLGIQTHEMPWNITLLLSLLAVQAFNCIFTIAMVVIMHPLTTSVYSTLDDVNILVPEMNNTLHDIKLATVTIDSICNSVGCTRV